MKWVLPMMLQYAWACVPMSQGALQVVSASQAASAVPQLPLWLVEFHLGNLVLWLGTMRLEQEAEMCPWV